MKITSVFGKWMTLLSLSTAIGFLISCSGPAGKSGSGLEAGFIDPPESARPRVWWHWMNGNINKEGIRADLEWMHRTGIGGFQNFDAGLASPQIVEKRLIYMTPEWKDAFLFTTKLADSLGLEMAIAGSPGWSESGGPWVPPSQAMKKYVWTETIAEGEKEFRGTLPKPASTTGRFQNLPGAGGFSTGGEEPPEFYADAAVIAYRIPEKDKSLAELKPKVTSSSGKFDLASLCDGDLNNFSFLPAASPGEKAWIQFEFQNPETFNSFSATVRETTFSIPGFRSQGFKRELESSDDGKKFTLVCEIPRTDLPEATFSTPAFTAKFIRITFTTPPLPPDYGDLLAQLGDMIPKMPKINPGNQISEVALSTVGRINRFEDKAGFTSMPGLYNVATPTRDQADAIKPQDVINLTSRMASDGSLEWTPPAGRWNILRFGYTLTGHRNSPASPEATGLEVDKLNRNHVKAYFENYLDQYKDATGGLMGKKGLRYVITDSWEAGVQNWTDSMMTEFSRRRGYNMASWMPALTGRVVESPEASDRFLWDFRKTIADLTAENHYDNLTTILHERGMGRYTESHESGRAFIGDGMEVKRKADIPMSATWVPGGFAGDEKTGVAVRFRADVRESASVAHIYGQNLVAAESMTAIGNTWAYAPERLKPTADMEMACGLNRFVIHTSVHQPVSDKIPGLGLGPFGQWFTRHETWAEYARPWILYLARSSFMLQQGKFVADVAWYYGDDNNITALFGENLPDVPEGFNYDFVNSDALLNELSVKNGEITASGRTNYRILALDHNARYMTLPVLKKITELVKEGAIVAGQKPLGSPSLSDDQAEFGKIAGQLWTTDKGFTPYGKGKVYTGMSVGEVMTDLGIMPDFDYTRSDTNTNIMYVHRKLQDADIYWVNNRNNRSENTEASFRITGKEPEIWNPETGAISPASYKIAEGRTRIPLSLVPADAIFVVFRKSTGESARSIPVPEERLVTEISGPWTVAFQPDRGAPSGKILDTLRSWSEDPDQGIRYFSGTATYTKDLEVQQEWLNDGQELIMDLGDVKNLAEVLVNGKSLGIVWKHPFRVDVTSALSQGKNTIEVKVTNLWVNRLIGDQQPGIEKKYTYTTQAFYRADSPLLPSGLLGPVMLISKSF